MQVLDRAARAKAVRIKVQICVYELINDGKIQCNAGIADYVRVRSANFQVNQRRKTAQISNGFRLMFYSAVLLLMRNIAGFYAVPFCPNDRKFNIEYMRAKMVYVVHIDGLFCFVESSVCVVPCGKSSVLNYFECAFVMYFK